MAYALIQVNSHLFIDFGGNCMFALKEITGTSFFNPLAAKNLNCLAIKTANSAGT